MVEVWQDLKYQPDPMYQYVQKLSSSKSILFSLPVSGDISTSSILKLSTSALFVQNRGTNLVTLFFFVGISSFTTHIHRLCYLAFIAFCPPFLFCKNVCISLRFLFLWNIFHTDINELTVCILRVLQPFGVKRLFSGWRGGNCFIGTHIVCSNKHNFGDSP